MTEQKIFLDLPPELKRTLESSELKIMDIVRRQGFDLALEILPEELPGFDEDGRERGIGMVLMGTAALTLSLGAAAAIVIQALSSFYREREQAPVLVETYVQQQEKAPDGTTLTRLVKDKVFREPDRIESSAEIEAKLNLSDGVTVRFRSGKVGD